MKKVTLTVQWGQYDIKLHLTVQWGQYDIKLD